MKKIVGPISTKNLDRVRAQWEEVYLTLNKSRQQFIDNFETEYSDLFADKCVDQATQRYQNLISLMLSAQTKDIVTEGNLHSAAMLRLKNHGLTILNIQQTPEKKLAELIYPVSFYNTKAKNIKKTTEILVEKYYFDTPKTYKEVLKLPGVGPKMGLLFMQIVNFIQSFDEVHGIAVDTHVHRVANRLGWANSKTPEGTRAQIESFLPNSVWGEINILLVGHGQTVCKPIKPRCWECSLAEVCPTGQENLKNTPAKKTKKSKTIEKSE